MWAGTDASARYAALLPYRTDASFALPAALPIHGRALSIALPVRYFTDPRDYRSRARRAPLLLLARLTTKDIFGGKQLGCFFPPTGEYSIFWFSLFERFSWPSSLTNSNTMRQNK